MEEIANQSDVSVQESAAPIETSQVTTEAPATTQEAPSGRTVKFNKEDRFVPDEEVDTYLQKGLNYDKVSERAKEAETYQQNLERVAKFYGFDNHSDYMKALDEHEREKEIQNEADRRGVDVSVVRQFRDEIEPLKQEVNGFKQEKEALAKERALVQIDKDVIDLKTKYPDFEKHKDQVFELAIKEGYKLEDAYKLATYEDKISGIAKQTEAETLRKVQQNRETATGSLGSGGVEHKTGFAAMTKDDQRRMIEEVKQGKRTSFD